jgi:hypothetical protein
LPGRASGRFDVPGFTPSSPVAASGQLFLRTKEALFSIGKRAY